MAAAQPAKHERTPTFARDAGRSHGDARSENALIHGENLSAMTRLAQAGFAGRFRCIYLDPPFNSGRRFAEYDDALSPEAWRAMMRERLEAARELLAEDGAVFVEIDDTELGPLQVVMDDVYGREQRVSTITVVRSAATGHKAINRGPVNVTDFVLAYARARGGRRSSASRWSTPSTSSASPSRGTTPSARARAPSSIALGGSPSASFASSATGGRPSCCAAATASSFWPTRSSSATGSACWSSR
jgi:hypothetical protein